MQNWKPLFKSQTGMPTNPTKNDLYRKKYQYFRFDHWHELYIKFVTAFVQLIIKQRLLKLSCTLKNVQYVHFGICISSTFHCKTVVTITVRLQYQKDVYLFIILISCTIGPQRRKKNRSTKLCVRIHTLNGVIYT